MVKILVKSFRTKLKILRNFSRTFTIKLSKITLNMVNSPKYTTLHVILT